MSCAVVASHFHAFTPHHTTLPDVSVDMCALVHATQSVRDCWAVAFGNSFNDEERVVAAGYDNGDVKLFDLRTNSLRYETNVNNGVTGIEFDRSDIEMNKFGVTTLESKFRVYDARTQHATEGMAYLSEKVRGVGAQMQWCVCACFCRGRGAGEGLGVTPRVTVCHGGTQAHKSTVWLVRHLPQNRDVFMTGGGNGGFNLYKYHYPSARTKTAKDNQPMGVPGTVRHCTCVCVYVCQFWRMLWQSSPHGACGCAFMCTGGAPELQGHLDAAYSRV